MTAKSRSPGTAGTGATESAIIAERSTRAAKSLQILNVRISFVDSGRQPMTTTSTENFIIVERDLDLRDSGVFTGQIQIVETRLMLFEDGRPIQSIDGIASPHIEHAFVFHSAWTAWRFAMQFEPHWDAGRRRYWGFRRWVARRDGDFFPGECRHGINAPNPCIHGKTWIPHEAIMAAAADSFEQGRRSALAEMGQPQ